MLNEMDRSLLDFEREWIALVGPKDREIETVLGLTSEAYYARLRELISHPHARDYDPLTLRRLQVAIDPGSRVEAVI